MQPARFDITLRAYDTVDVAIGLWLQQDSGRIALVPASDETLTLRLGAVTASTRDTGPGRLVLDAAPGTTTLRRRLLPQETAGFATGNPTLSLVRSSPNLGHRTYLVGAVKALDALAAGPGDPKLDLTVSDAGVTADITISDGGAATAISTLRDGVPAAGDTLAKLFTLITGFASEADVAQAVSAAQQFLLRPVDPAPADIPVGAFRVVKNTATGRFSLWVNDGGTLIDLLAFTPASS